MTTVKRSGTEFSFPLAVELPKIDPLPKVTLHAPVRVSAKLKRTDPKSDVGQFILKEYESLLKRSIDLRLKPLTANLNQLWKVAAKAMAGAKDQATARKVAAKAEAQAKKEIAGLVNILETTTIHAALTQARKAAEKKFKERLGDEESVTAKGVREFGKQASEVGEALYGAVETVSDIAETATNPIKLFKALKDLAKGKVEIWDKMVDLYRKASKERQAKLARVKDRFTKAKALFEEVDDEIAELRAIQNALASQLSSTTGLYEKLDRKIEGVRNLDLGNSRSRLFALLEKDGAAAGKVLDEVAKTLKDRAQLQKKVNVAIKAINDVMNELDVEIKVSSVDGPVIKKLDVVRKQHQSAVSAIQAAA